MGQHNNRKEWETVIQTLKTYLDPQHTPSVDRYRHVFHRDPKEAKQGKRKIRKKIAFFLKTLKV